MSVAAGNKNHLIRLIAVVLTGILAGLSGMVLALILHAIQHLAFGYSYGQIVGSVSFLQGVTESSWPRRIVAIVAGGAVAGFGWWLLGRYGQRRVSIAAAVANPCAPMPAGTIITGEGPFLRLLQKPRVRVQTSISCGSCGDVDVK